MCQSPSPRGTHFYGATMCYYGPDYDCVNPLHLGELISTAEYLDDERNNKRVSIPFTSGNSFLLDENFDLLKARMCVNPLHLGELISTLTLIFC